MAELVNGELKMSNEEFMKVGFRIVKIFIYRKPQHGATENNVRLLNGQTVLTK